MLMDDVGRLFGFDWKWNEGNITLYILLCIIVLLGRYLGNMSCFPQSPVRPLWARVRQH